MRSNHNGRAMPRNLGRAAVGAIFAALMGVPAGAAWDGTQKIRLGDSVGAEFAAAVGSESHVFSFFAPETTKVSALVKPLLKTSGLAAKVDLVDGGGANVALGTAGTGAAIKNFVIANRGTYGFTVTSTAGTGEYRLTTKAAWPKQFGAQLTTASTFEFGAPAGATVDVAVKKAKSSAAVPSVTGVVGPTGALTLTAGALVRKLAIPADGKYRVTVANTGTPGDPIDLVVKFTAPKGKRTWGFGSMDEVRADIRIQQDWTGSGHANRSAEAFRHWDANLPQVVDLGCARCHSGDGYEDFIGSDGSAAGTVEKAPVVDRTVDCNACHNDVTRVLTQVTFESTGNLAPTAPLAAVTPKMITGLGDESRCMICHQGRESKYTLDSMISLAFLDTTTTPATLGPINEDLPVTTGTYKIGFKNIHYFAAAATLYGREAGVGYEYTGKAYEKKFTHVDAYNTCIECHDPHTLKVKVSACATCHEIDPANAADPAKYSLAIDDLHRARMAGTLADYDGDGDATEGLHAELVGMSDMLLLSMREYAKDVLGAPIAYNGAAYPYFFSDANDNGMADPGEGSYSKWTARLVKAAFNYQMFQKDPGGFAHNGKYLMELMYDSIADIDVHALVDVRKVNGYPADFASLVRNDSGHFDTSADQFRHWDAAGAVDAGCARCHSNDGFVFRAQYGIDTTVTQPTTSGLACEACHVSSADFKSAPALRYFASVTWPSLVQTPITTANGPKGTATDDPSFVCIQCHMGRESTATLDAKILTSSFSFRNVHYFPAGASVYGNVAKVAYQYAAPSAAYAGKWLHKDVAFGPTDGERCMFCHGDEHSFEVQTTGADKQCSLCHGGTDWTTYRLGAGLVGVNLDGLITTTTLKAELGTFGARLYAGMREYTVVKAKPMIRYDALAYPYFFADTNNNGLVEVEPYTDTNGNKKYDLGEPFTDTNGNSVCDQDIAYPSFDAALTKAAFNYQYFNKEPGLWAHNARYGFQILYESVRDLAAAGPLVTNTLAAPTLLTRP
ncbi:MAG: hypothetical protein K8T90_07470 [Planctomycetes bacterium]|nr:hypothetical protein [Planctomycetota bacterium]